MVWSEHPLSFVQGGGPCWFLKRAAKTREPAFLPDRAVVWVLDFFRVGQRVYVVAAGEGRVLLTVHTGPSSQAAASVRLVQPAHVGRRRAQKPLWDLCSVSSSQSSHEFFKSGFHDRRDRLSFLSHAAFKAGLATGEYCSLEA